MRRNIVDGTTHKKGTQSGSNIDLHEECERWRWWRWQWMAIHMIWLIRRHSRLLWIRYAKQWMALLVNSTHSNFFFSCLTLINMILWTGTHATNDELMDFFSMRKIYCEILCCQNWLQSASALFMLFFCPFFRKMFCSQSKSSFFTN